MMETKHVIFTHNLSFTSLTSGFTYGIHLLKQTAHLKLRKMFKIVQKRLKILKSYNFSKNHSKDDLSGAAPPVQITCARGPSGAEFPFGIINHNFMKPRWLGTCAEFHAAQILDVPPAS
jgi:hypothetical protein